MSFFRRLNPSLLHTFRHYERCLDNVSRTKEQKNFLQRCIREQVVPKTFDVHVNNKDHEAYPPVRRLLVQDRVDHAAQQLEDAHHKLRSASHQLQRSCHTGTLGDLKAAAKRKVARRSRWHCLTLDRKLHKLCQNTVWEKFSIKENVHNRSNFRMLSKDEHILLGLGNGFNMEASRKDMVGSVHSFDYFRDKNKPHIEDMDVVQGVVPFMLQSLVKSDKVLPERLEKAKRSLMNDNSIVIIPADKGGQVVILDRWEYNIAMMRLLTGSDSNYEKKSVNALNNAHRDIRSEVRSISQTLTGARNEAGEVLRKILPLNPGAAKFYGIPKIHKATETNIPFRPIVSSVGTLTRGLAGWLAKQLNPLVGTFSSAHIKNNVDFKEKLRNYSSANNSVDFTMLSLDVKSLFTQVPLSDVLDFLERKANSCKNVLKSPSFGQ